MEHRRSTAGSTLCLLLAAFVVAGCEDQGTDPFRFQQVVISPSGGFPGGRGASVRFEASMVDAEGDVIDTGDFTWVWISSDPGVIEITPEGVARAGGRNGAHHRARGQHRGLDRSDREPGRDAHGRHAGRSPDRHGR